MGGGPGEAVVGGSSPAAEEEEEQGSETWGCVNVFSTWQRWTLHLLHFGGVFRPFVVCDRMHLHINLQGNSNAKIYWELNYNNMSHAKGKASTAKQTCLGSLLGLEMTTYRKDISSLGRLPCHRDFKKTTLPPLRTIEILLPDGNVTCSGRIGFVLGVWLPLVLIHIKMWDSYMYNHYIWKLLLDLRCRTRCTPKHDMKHQILWNHS